MRLLHRAAPVAVALALIAPAAAVADTTVDPAFGGTCERNGTCKTIQAAIDAAQQEDRIIVKPGAYTENLSVPAGKNGLTIDGVTAGVAVSGHVTVGSANVKILHLAIAKTTGAEPAIAVNAAGFELNDSQIVSTVSHAVVINNAGGTVRRSVIASALPAGDGLRVTNSAAAASGVEADSSIILGGSQGASTSVTSTGGSTGPTTLDLRHVTLPETGGRAIRLDSSGAVGALSPSGNITANITGSVAHGLAPSSAINYVSDTELLTRSNVILVKFANVDANAMTRQSQTFLGPAPAGAKGPNIDIGSPALNSDSVLFDNTFHLRTTSPAIDQGGGIIGDESPTDIDGEPRSSGASTDIGADEFVNKAPVARDFILDPAEPKSGQIFTVTGDAIDPNPGDKLTYGFDWGDGTPGQTLENNAIQHLYAEPGTYTIKFAVVDSFGLASSILEKTITVTDGQAPNVRVTGRKLLVKRAELRVRGAVSDPSGVSKVEIALTRTAGCRQYTGTGFVRNTGKCKNSLRWINAPLIGGTRFEITTNPDVKIKKGAYVLRVRGTDRLGNVGQRFRAKAKTLVKFKVR